MACPCGIGAVPTASLQLTRRPRRYPRGSSIGTGGMLGDFSTHSSVGPPQPVPPDGGAVQQAADEFPPRLQRTLDLRLAPDQLAALVLMAEQADAWSGVPPILLEEIAASIAVAVDHCAAYEELGRLRDEQAALLEINRTVARHLHRDELFATLAQCLRDVLPSDRFGIELPVAGDKLRASVLEPGTGSPP